MMEQKARIKNQESRMNKKSAGQITEGTEKRDFSTTQADAFADERPRRVGLFRSK